MGLVVLRVLGGVDVVLPDGTTREVRGTRRRAVLAHLAATGHPVSADELLAAHFDEPRSGRKAVQVLVAELRGWARELGLVDGLVVTVGQGYTLGAATDLGQLREADARARKAREEGDLASALEVATAAQALVGGPAFAPVAPSASIVGLADAVDGEVARLDELVASLRREVADGHDVASTPRGTGRASSGGLLPFVGRDRELARCRPLVRSIMARAATRAWLRVTGPGGSGRRRLVDQLLAELATADVLSMACQPEHPGLDLSAPLGVVFDDAAPTDPAWRSAERADAIARRLVQRSRRRPQVLVVEELQWAGPALAGQLMACLRHPGAHCLLVTTSGPEEPEEHALKLRRSLGPVVRGVDVRLGPLPDAPLADAVRTIARERDGGLDPDALADWVVANAGGSPLHATELVRSAISGGAIPREVPTALRALLRARLEQRSEPARAIIGALAVLGDGTQVDRVVAVAAATSGDATAPARLDQALHELVEHELVEVRGTIVHLRQQALVTAARALVGPSGVSSLHLAAAEDLARRRVVGLDIDTSEEARHRMAALPSGSIDATLEALLVAAARTDDPIDPEQRLADVRVALSRLVGLVDDADHRLLMLRVVHGEALADNGETGDARRTLLAAGRHAVEVGADAAAVRAGVALGRLFATISHDPEALELLRAALDLADDPADRTVLLGALALSGFLDLDDELAALADEALLEARRAGDARSLANGLNAHHLATAGFDVAASLASAQGCVVAAHRARDARAQVVAHLTRAKELLVAGRLPDAEQDLEVASALADRLGDVRLSWMHATWVPVVHLLRGAVVPATNAVEAAAGMLHEDPDASFIESVQRAVLDLLDGRGRAVAHLGLIFTESSPRAASFRGTVAYAHLVEREVDQALAHLDRLVRDDLGGAPYSRYWLVGLAAAARTIAALTDAGMLSAGDHIGGRLVRDVASDLADRMAPMAGQQVVLRLVRAGGFAFGPVDLARADALRLAGRTSEADTVRASAHAWTAANDATFWNTWHPLG